MSFRVELKDDVLSFEEYPFKLPDVGHGIRLGDIEEVHLDRRPIELWLKSGDIAFFPDRQAHLLYEIHRGRSLPITWRTDTWDCLLTPFLDAEHPPEVLSRVDERLQEEGFSRDEIKELRRWASPVKWVNAFAWEWVGLGLFDLLMAYRLLPPFFSRRSTYRRAVSVARRGRPAPAAAGIDPFNRFPQVKLHRFWNETIQGIAPGKEEAFAVLDAVLGRYQEPARSYHHLDHLLEVLDLLKVLGVEPGAKPALWLAAFFHDFIYSPRARDNEERSAAEALLQCVLRGSR